MKIQAGLFVDNFTNKARILSATGKDYLRMFIYITLKVVKLKQYKKVSSLV